MFKILKGYISVLTFKVRTNRLKRAFGKIQSLKLPKNMMDYHLFNFKMKKYRRIYSRITSKMQKV